jgi:tryptophan-rich sensory protein
MTRGLLVLGSLLTLLLTLRLKPVDVSQRVSFQPANYAFGVAWSAIFAAIAATGVVVTVDDRDFGWGWTGALVTALASCIGWTLVQARNRKVAFAMLLLGALAANVGVALLVPRSARQWGAAIGPSLLAGWLSLASVLGAALAWGEARVASWWLVVASCATTLPHIFVGNPTVSALLLFVSHTLPPSKTSASVFMVAIVGAVACIPSLLR